MRNLKRALSLALASVMLLGMMVVGTGAYSDVAATDNVEAIEVVEAAGIMIGDDKGNFNPDQKVTRNQMAVVMANMLGLDVEDYAGIAPFTDVPAWAEAYVSACYAEGIVSGTSATTYTGDAEVMAVDAGLMVMKALGYFAFPVDFGDDYKVATISKASEIDLYDDITAKTNDTLTRNEVAQLVLNALETKVVKGTQSGNTTSITAGDVKVEVTGKTTYNPVKGDGFDYAGNWAEDKDDDDFTYLIEKLFEDDFTKGAADPDLYGRAANAWFDEDGDEIVKLVEDATYVLVATEDTTLAELVEDAKLTKKVLETEEGTYADFTAIEYAAGTVVELWVDKDTKTITDELNVAYTALKIEKIEALDEDLDEDDIEAGAAVTVIFEDESEMLDIELANFDEDTYVKGAYVLFPVSSKTGAIEDVYEFIEDEYSTTVSYDTVIAETFVGKVQGQGSDYVKVDGKKYNNDAMNEVTTGTEYTFVKDVNDVIILAAEVEDESETIPVDDVVFLYDTYVEETEDKWGNTVTTTTAQIINLKGEISEVVIKIEKDYADETKDDETFGTIEYDDADVFTAKAYTTNKWFVGDEAAEEEDEGAINYKGVTKLSVWDFDAEKNDVIDGAGVVFATDASKNDVVRYNDKVTFVLVEGAEDDVKTEVKTGKQNVTLPEGSIIIATIDNDNAVAAYVYAPGAEVSSSVSYDDVIYVDATAEIYNTTVVVDDEDVDVDVFEAYNAKGEKVEITIEDGAMPESGFYTFSIEDGIYTLSDEDLDAYDADLQEGVAYEQAYASYYGTLLTTNGIEDLETEGATWIDLSEKDEDEGAQWTKVIKTLAGLKKAVDDGACSFDIAIYAEDEAAKIIVITDAIAE